MAYKMKGHELPGPNQRQSPNKAIKVQGLKNVAAGALTMMALPMSIMKGMQMEAETSKGGAKEDGGFYGTKAPSKFRYKSPAKKFGQGNLLNTGQERDPKTGKKGCAPGDVMCMGAKTHKQNLGLVLGAGALMSPWFRKLGKDATIG